MLDTAGMLVAAICRSDCGSAVMSTSTNSILYSVVSVSKAGRHEESYASGSCLACSLCASMGCGAGVMPGGMGTTAPDTRLNNPAPRRKLHLRSECMYKLRSRTESERGSKKE